MRELMRQRLLTTIEVAKLFGVTQQHASRIGRGLTRG